MYCWVCWLNVKTTGDKSIKRRQDTGPRDAVSADERAAESGSDKHSRRRTDDNNKEPCVKNIARVDQNVCGE